MTGWGRHVVELTITYIFSKSEFFRLHSLLLKGHMQNEFILKVSSPTVYDDCQEEFEQYESKTMSLVRVSLLILTLRTRRPSLVDATKTIPNPYYLLWKLPLLGH